jgi:uncharacterized DUF497 family protein
MGLIDRYDGFDWDGGNSYKNWLKHGVTREETEQAFSNDPFYVDEDIKHSEAETRRKVLAKTDMGRLLFIAFTIRKHRVRTICSRPASRKERKQYDEEIERNS